MVQLPTYVEPTYCPSNSLLCHALGMVMYHPQENADSCETSGIKIHAQSCLMLYGGHMLGYYHLSNYLKVVSHRKIK